MNLTVTTPAKMMAEKRISSVCLTSLSSKKSTGFLEADEFEFSTIDGGVVTYDAGASAISRGAGIFIGDYFVGITENYELVSNQPFVRY
ncbi:MAG: hypothetical protein LPK09_11475 [Hymenobacteraceae bacterium]|nr:hypothetical protein [Hymenobacteraceae bacterium]